MYFAGGVWVYLSLGVLLALASQTITTEGLTGTWSHRLETLVFWVGIVVCVVGILSCLPTLNQSQGEMRRRMG